MSNPDESANSLYLYKPSHVLPAVFAALVGISLLMHTWQNLYVLSQLDSIKIPSQLMSKIVTTGSGESPSLSPGVASSSP